MSSANLPGSSRNQFFIDSNQYSSLLFSKVGKTVELLWSFLPRKIQEEWLLLKKQKTLPFHQESLLSVFPSPKKFFRLRIRLGILSKPDSPLQFAVWDKGGLVAFPAEAPSVCYPIPAKNICEIMPELLRLVNKSKALSSNLRACHFVTTLLGDQTIITLVYERQLLYPYTNKGYVSVDNLSVLKQEKASELSEFGREILESEWVVEAQKLKEELENNFEKESIHVMGRCKGTAVVVGSNYVIEELKIPQVASALRYRKVEGAFSNPNGAVNVSALEWLYLTAKHISSSERFSPTNPITLLEMYCGNCNHTCALAPLFEKVTAVELNQKLCTAAELNLELNNIKNVSVWQSDSAKVSRRVMKSVETTRTLEWDVLLVDPPRGGLDADTLRMLKYFDHILYISCNPNSLKNNLEQSGICATHSIEKYANFDQFAYTPHIETGVYLRRKIQ